MTMMRQYVEREAVRAFLTHRERFDRTIGQLDRILSELVTFARAGDLDQQDQQTLKHHAEDMEAAARHIYKNLGAVEGAPKPEPVEEVVSRAMIAIRFTGPPKSGKTTLARKVAAFVEASGATATIDSKTDTISVSHIRKGHTCP